MAARSAEQRRKNSRRAWSVIVMGENQQYAGNRGYVDDPRRVYRYTHGRLRPSSEPLQKRWQIFTSPARGRSGRQ